ncbi:bifunctional riboflavin kinase/FAD synthetase [Pseudanabaena sp. ABRG5-3]|uniref:bifunctional riboflavin kinase/FAD synthetase n=1 Tax=Pseudanabaena sp. ABRG5-3 TaxID=685565 RepID=UPI000DC6EBE2|nr:bifunctional riboflavin kinase/FAD synthetase [Pseudanabaena sp. ABRG5-3]BBC23916.1 bifunctional riboflavin kinase/FMN adenylyltransferase [Pseudanabaena sp. ABRG5-3]
MRVIFDPTQISRPTAIALGNFDGVHIGHRHVIAPILPSALSDRHQHLTSTVVSFSPHPQEFFSKQPRSLLAPFDEKVALLESLGVEQLVLLPFDADLAKLTAAEFIQQILIDSLQVELISVGCDFHFGQKRQGNINDLKNVWGDRLTVISEQTMLLNDSAPIRISSSNIRAALAKGEVDLANVLLGRPYNLVGKVVQGKQLGRTIGFPTANLDLPVQKCLPRDGVYAVQVNISSSPKPVFGVMNIGLRPTVNGDRRTVEVHLFDWQGDLYNQELNVDLVKFIRPEQKFASLDALKKQIKTDCQTALNHFKQAVKLP